MTTRHLFVTSGAQCGRDGLRELIARDKQAAKYHDEIGRGLDIEYSKSPGPRRKHVWSDVTANNFPHQVDQQKNYDNARKDRLQASPPYADRRTIDFNPFMDTVSPHSMPTN
ncbi:hypothetical protein ABZ815_27170 [Nonomuraea sp. NPDC047529]|uniref:hypothetical protein n=1 Tax=Nonomuraea sp. NPDC047529 TaxID=3155623 RepID=UPI003411BD9D